MLETMNPTAGGGGGIDNTPRPVDFEEPDDPRNDRKERVKGAVLSSQYIMRSGGLKRQYAGVLPPELARTIERRADTAPWAGEIAVIGYNQFDYEPSEN